MLLLWVIDHQMIESGLSEMRRKRRTHAGITSAASGHLTETLPRMEPRDFCPVNQLSGGCSPVASLCLST